ncbi:DUF6119 family protein [Croceibacterium sp. TMG7-5b_MA50]|uniref:DUF6119 family protein n=1 Tax=Croceibacterium sp. TMG7-5b_MA50 TaxID=3121290 RepID=UPI003221C78F
MGEKTQNIALRLLRKEVCPEDAVRAGVSIEAWPTLEGAMICTGSAGGSAPTWTDFLELNGTQKEELKQRFSFGLVFIPVDERWFAVSFGFGHTKLKADVVQEDFGLRVVINSVDHRKLRSADLRTPDTTTMSRRSQTSRGSGRDVFAIDPERDIVRGLLGEPKDPSFATKISGSDSLMIRRKMKVADLPDLCAKALELHDCDEYKTEFGWIDQVRHVREPDKLDELQTALVNAMTEALNLPPDEADDLALAFPAIYDPEKSAWVRFRGLRRSIVYPDLDIRHYLEELRSKNILLYEAQYLTSHLVEECDEDGARTGSSWPIRDCLVFETSIADERYTLTGGRWYKIDSDLAAEVTSFFDGVEKITLPSAEPGDNEKRYNARVASTSSDLLDLDVKLVRPSGSTSSIELCDFLGLDGRFIHIKDKSESSRLSHLWNQGLISAVTLKRDPLFRDEARTVIADQPNGAAYVNIIADSNSSFDPSKHKIVFGVLVSGKREPNLPFFSLISFRHAARRISAELGFPVAFSWIKKSDVGLGKPVPRKTKMAA